MQKEPINSNINAGRAADLTSNSGNEVKTYHFIIPPTTFLVIPDEYKDLLIEDGKPFKTNWERLIEKESDGKIFDFFFQEKSTLSLWRNIILECPGIPKAGNNWPILNLINREYVKVEKVPFYKLIITQKWGGDIMDSPCVIDYSPDFPQAEIISKKLIKEYDYAAFYNGPISK